VLPSWPVFSCWEWVLGSPSTQLSIQTPRSAAVVVVVVVVDCDRIVHYMGVTSDVRVSWAHLFSVVIIEVVLVVVSFHILSISLDRIWHRVTPSIRMPLTQKYAR